MDDSTKIGLAIAAIVAGGAYYFAGTKARRQRTRARWSGFSTYVRAKRAGWGGKFRGFRDRMRSRWQNRKFLKRRR